MSPPRGVPLVYVADLDVPELDADDHHHLARVLRVRPGDPVTVGDGRGGWRPARFAGTRPEPAGPVERVAAPAPPVTLAFAIPKGDRPEWIVQKGTELGVDVFVPMHCARSVVRWDDGRGPRHVERLRRVAKEAAMQSRRAWLPRVDTPRTFAACSTLAGAVVAEPGGAALTTDRLTILVGPEGGFTAEELALAPATLGLGDTVLRVETAALAAATLATALRDGRCSPPPGARS